MKKITQETTGTTAVTAPTPTDKMTINNFYEFEISQEINDALADMGFDEPTPIQAEVIPYVLKGSDVMAQAPTGTGKTCAFGIPIIEMIDNSNGVQALILCPTRELVMQTVAQLNDVAKYKKNIKVLAIFGGQQMDRQLFGLRKNPQIVVGTTGRIMDHLRRKSLKLDTIKMLVLDEADEMLNMGFREDIDTILETAPTDRQTIMFSATMPKEILGISKKYQHDPISIKTQHHNNEIPPIAQFCYVVKEEQKMSGLLQLLDEKQFNLSLIFCNTKRKVDDVSMKLLELGYSVEALHGDMRQSNRDKIMRKYRNGETKILVATDVAARGIDVNDIEAVINYDVPNDEEYYVHRIGRTARANKLGSAYTFALRNQVFAIRNFERITKAKITVLDKAVSDSTSSIKTLQVALIKMKSVKDKDRKIITEELEKYNEANSSTFTYADLCASLLSMNSSTSDDNFDRPSSRNSDSGRSDSGRNNNSFESRSGGLVANSISNGDRPIRKPKPSYKTTRFFLNIGRMDQVDSVKIREIFMGKTSIKEESIADINVLENYSFLEVDSIFEDEMLTMNDTKIGKRKLVVEIAVPRDRDLGGASGKKDFSSRGDKKDFSPRGDKKDFKRGEKKDFSPRFGDKKNFSKPGNFAAKKKWDK